MTTDKPGNASPSAGVNEYWAAGAVLVDGAGRVLLLDRWVARDGGPAKEVRLPKGHLEAGESAADAGLRETCEESGYCDLVIVADLGERLTEFTRGGEQVVRHERFFLMRLGPKEEQSGAGAKGEGEPWFRRRWVASLAEAERELTFGPEREFVRRARAYLET